MDFENNLESSLFSNSVNHFVLLNGFLEKEIINDQTQLGKSIQWQLSVLKFVLITKLFVN